MLEGTLNSLAGLGVIARPKIGHIVPRQFHSLHLLMHVFSCDQALQGGTSFETRQTADFKNGTPNARISQGSAETERITGSDGFHSAQLQQTVWSAEIWKCPTECLVRV